jgi:hypothetical protein
MIGHAFRSSGLVAASFVYFRDGTKWMEDFIKQGSRNVNGQKA